MDDAVTMRAGDGAPLGCIGQYELVRELGGGGFGCVYLAHDTVSGIDVAVKGLPPLVRNNREELENIRRNFVLVSRLHHPHIAAALVLHPAKTVTYADRATAEKLRVFEGDFLVVMEYAPGVTLSQWRKQFPDGKVPAAQVLEIVRQLADALDYAHAEKIIHRDIKPANVMIETRAGGSLVTRDLDFGLAAEVRSSMGRMSQQVTDKSGTRPYMAPEQWLGKKQNAATDQYALAVLAYELLAGEVPFASVFETGDPVVMMNVVGREVPDLSSDLPRGMLKACMTALAKAPEQRFASCRAFAEALTHGRARTPSAPLGWIAAAFVVLAALGAGGYLWQRQSAGGAMPDGQARAVSQSPQSADAELLVFQLSSKAESAHGLIEKEPEEVRRFFADEIRAFENARRAGDDAKRLSKNEVATKILQQALDKATALRGLVQRRQEYLAAESRARQVRLKCDALDAKSLFPQRYEEADGRMAAAVSSAAHKAFADAVAGVKDSSVRFDALFQDSVKSLLETAEGHLGAGRNVECLEIAKRVLSAEPQTTSAASFKERAEAAISANAILASEGDLIERLDGLVRNPNRMSHKWSRAWQRLRSFRNRDITGCYEKKGDSSDQHGLLTDAIVLGADVATVRYLVEKKGCSVTEVVDFEKCSPLHVAVELDNTNVVRYLIRSGADVKAKGSSWIGTPFCYVCGEAVGDMLLAAGAKAETSVYQRNGSLDFGLYLRSKGVGFSSEDLCRRAAADGRIDYLQEHCADCKKAEDLMLYGVRSGDMKTIKWLETQGFPFSVTNKSGATVLHTAASSKKITASVYRHILEKSGRSAIRPDANGMTPLHSVVCPEAVEILIAAGADAEVRDKRGSTPLMIAAGQRLDVVKALLKHGVNVDARDNNKWTPLCMAVARYDFEAAECLLEHGANPNAEAGENSGWKTPLFSAVASGDERLVRLLLKHGAKVNAVIEKEHQKTVLNQACFNEDLPMVKILLEAGADINLKVGSMSPLGEAVLGIHQFGKLDVVRYLVEKGAKVEPDFAKHTKNQALKDYLDQVCKPQREATEKALGLFKDEKYVEGFVAAKEAERENPSIQFNLGWCYDNGFGVAKDVAEAARWYRKAAEQGDKDAQYNLGWNYEHGEGVAKDMTAASKWYEKAARQGKSKAQYAIAVFYDNGTVVSKDIHEAVRWFKKAAKQDHARAQCRLGYCYEVGEGVTKDAFEAAKWYRKAADMGDATAQGNLGLCYENGRGLEKNIYEAVKWYRKAAEQGHADAQCCLGFCYDEGNGVTKDVYEAVKWYRKAADQGNARAQCNLGYCYDKGAGVHKDAFEAVTWYKKSAEQGYAQAQNNLACCYSNGSGIGKDEYEAVLWFKKAARQGHEGAQKSLRNRNVSW